MKFSKYISKGEKTSMDYQWLFLTDLNGCIRTKIVPETLNWTAFSGMFVNDMIDTPIVPLRNGDSAPNVLAFADDTSRLWKDYTLRFCTAFINKKVQSDMCPRTLLQSVIRQFSELGFNITCGMEAEWTVKSAKKNDSTSASYNISRLLNSEIRDYIFNVLNSCKKSKINVDSVHTETGEDMMEVAMSPSDPLSVADNMQLFRVIAKTEAEKLDLFANFMAKPNENAAGCGSHIHVSIQKDGQDVTEQILDQFLSGLLQGLRDLVCMFCPSSNSYARLSGFCAPKHVSFGLDNRHGVIRIVNYGSPRIEVRLGGADMNPYLGLSATLLAGLYGIIHNTELTSKPEQIVCELPKTAHIAVDFFEAEESFARKVLSKNFIHHYADSRRFEANMRGEFCKEWCEHVF